MKSFPALTAFTYVPLYLIFVFISSLISFPIIRVIDKKSTDIFQAINYITKKIIPIFLSITLLMLLFISIALDGFIVFTALIKAHNLFVTLIASAVLIVLIAVGFFLMLRIFFFHFLLILEEKFYFKAIARSLEYSRGHVASIFWKALVITIITVIATFTLLAIFSPISNFILDGSEFEKEMLRLVIGFIPSQFAIIAYYLLYKFYKIELPEDFSLTKKQKIITRVIVFPALLILGIILTGVIALESLNFFN